MTDFDLDQEFNDSKWETGLRHSENKVDNKKLIDLFLQQNCSSNSNIMVNNVQSESTEITLQGLLSDKRENPIKFGGQLERISNETKAETSIVDSSINKVQLSGFSTEKLLVQAAPKPPLYQGRNKFVKR